MSDSLEMDGFPGMGSLAPFSDLFCTSKLEWSSGSWGYLTANKTTHDNKHVFPNASRSEKVCVCFPHSDKVNKVYNLVSNYQL